MRIHIAADHAGFHHKETVVAWLREEGYEVLDHGAAIYNEQDDFPNFISLAAAAVSNGTDADRGIIFGGSGQGEAMVANRFPRVRAAVFYGGEETIPVLSRQHNDANMLSIGARFVTIDMTKRVLWDWLHTETLPDEKYHRRNRKIEQITEDIHS